MLKCYGECTGPLGFPMIETEARELDKFLENHSKDSACGYKHYQNPKSFEYFIEGEHADVSVISDSSIDLDKEIVSAKGLDFSPFEKRKQVTLNHNYDLFPIGKSIWWKRINDTWKAKTQYIQRPETHPKEAVWIPDVIWSLIKSGNMHGKSIGFLPSKWHSPTKEEIDKNINLTNVDLIWDEAKVYEYAVTTVNCNTNAVVEDIAKNYKAIPDILFKEFKDLTDNYEEFINKNKNRKQKQIELPTGFQTLNLNDYKMVIKNKINNIFDEKIKQTDIIVQETIKKLKGQI